jgi:hypothetical protein
MARIARIEKDDLRPTHPCDPCHPWLIGAMFGRGPQTRAEPESADPRQRPSTRVPTIPEWSLLIERLSDSPTSHRLE